MATKKVNSLCHIRKIKQIMAGYKANYNKQINNARTDGERKALVMAKRLFLAKRYDELVEGIVKELKQIRESI